MKTSNLFSLSTQDFLKGLFIAVGGAVVGVIETSLNAGSLTFDWKAIGGIALASGLSYLTKNFFTPAQHVSPASPGAPATSETPAKS